MSYKAEAKFGDRQKLAIDLGIWEFYAQARQSCEGHAVRVLEWDTLRHGLQEAATERYSYQIMSTQLGETQQHGNQQAIKPAETLLEPSLQAS